jgi:hypothetical protein
LIRTLRLKVKAGYAWLTDQRAEGGGGTGSS